jgi:hypothetical protein
MSDAMLFWCPRCGAGRHLAARPTDERVRCLQCGVFSPHDGRLFGHADWKATRDPERMIAALIELRCEPSARKWRLLTCAIGRTEFDWCRNPWFRDALDCAEQWADTGKQPPGVSSCATELGQMDIPHQHVPDEHSVGSSWNHGRLERLGWVRIALRAISDRPRLRSGDIAKSTRTVAAVLARELFPNPFGSLVWNPEWSTSTARELAAHIYTSREFAVMPILADALQDAGCENKHVLNHCRVEKTHARGCWVLDAILGKS